MFTQGKKAAERAACFLRLAGYEQRPALHQGKRGMIGTFQSLQPGDGGEGSVCLPVENEKMR